MSDQLTNQQTSDFGLHASQLLENPAFAKVFDHLRNEVQHAWRNADLRDKEGQQLLLQQAKIIDRVEETARRMIESGKLADSRIREEGLRAESALSRMTRKYF